MGQLYEGLKLDSKISLCYNFLQLLRRASFAAIAFGPIIKLQGSMQIMVTLYMSLVFTMYVGQVFPFKSTLKNRLEYYNEITIFYAVNSLFLFTDFNNSVENQFTLRYLRWDRIRSHNK
jgi:hypothetical protein